MMVSTGGVGGGGAIAMTKAAAGVGVRIAGIVFTAGTTPGTTAVAAAIVDGVATDSTHFFPMPATERRRQLLMKVRRENATSSGRRGASAFHFDNRSRASIMKELAAAAANVAAH
jgi:hypothetical protein